MRKKSYKVLSFVLTLALLVGLLPTVALAKEESADHREYTIQVGQTIDLYGSFGLSDWESDDSAIVRIDGTNSICPDSVTVTGVALTGEGETVEVRRTYSVREGDTWSAERQEEVFQIAVVNDLSDAPEGAVAVLLGQTVTLNASFGFSDWGSEDSSIARLDGTVTTAGFPIISPDQTTVTGVKPGVVNIVRSYFAVEDGQWVQQEEVFRIIVVE